MENENINTNATDTQMNSTNESKSESFANEALTANTNYGTISSADIENGTAELVLMKTSDADSISNFESPATEVSINQFYEGCITNPTECLIFKFVPPQNGMYTVHTIGNLNTLGRLYFEDTEEPIMTSDNSPRDNKNFRMERWLYKQRTYYIKVSSANRETGCFHIRVTDDILVSSVDIVPSVTVREGDTLDLSSITTICPSNATNKNVNYTCSDSCVATIMQTTNRDDNGIITYTSTLTAISHGTVIVKAYDFDGYGEIGECTVVVVESNWPSCSKPVIHSRSEWNPRDVVDDRLEARERMPEMIVFHHTADKFSSTETSNIISQIQKTQDDQMDEAEKCDISYHFVIDPAGGIWEGALIDRYKRGHATGHYDEIAVALLGDFEHRAVNLFMPNDLNDNQKNAMKALSKWLCYWYNLPIDKANGVCPITTHREVVDTVCPGDNAAPWIEEDLKNYINDWAL